MTTITALHLTVSPVVPGVTFLSGVRKRHPSTSVLSISAHCEAMAFNFVLWPGVVGLCSEGLGWEEEEPEGCPGGVHQESPG